MTFPEDRVLVGVINRRRDFEVARAEHWYRIPVAKAPRNIETEYLAFYFSRSFKEQNGGIFYYAPRTGHELVRRRDILPTEADHPRAMALYFKIQLGEMQAKEPPILNPTRRPIAFIYTTWDRFISAETIADLYTKDDWFVERVVTMLHRMGITSQQRWEAENPAARIAQLRIACERGVLIATAGEATDGAINLQTDDLDGSIAAIKQAVAALGGPTFVDIPLDG